MRIKLSNETFHFHAVSDTAFFYDFGRCAFILCQNDGNARSFHVAAGTDEL
jgi:oxalate decarboxylase/phosphoglucose isomerase-like protein (cupin superfamily)